MCTNTSFRRLRLNEAIAFGGVEHFTVPLVILSFLKAVPVAAPPRPVSPTIANLVSASSRSEVARRQQEIGLPKISASRLSLVNPNPMQGRRWIAYPDHIRVPRKPLGGGQCRVSSASITARASGPLQSAPRTAGPAHGPRVVDDVGRKAPPPADRGRRPELLRVLVKASGPCSADEARAFSRSPSRSMLTAATITRPDRPPAAGQVGISLTQGAHQVAQRLTTTTWGLQVGEAHSAALASRIGVVGAGLALAETSSLAISPWASDFRSTAPPPG